MASTQLDGGGQNSPVAVSVPGSIPTLTITRGLPASGKTTWARKQSAVRVNRDDLRSMLHGGWQGTARAEQQVSLAQRATVGALLSAGVSVVCDDTNLSARVVKELMELGAAHDARVEVRDFTDVPVYECVRRDGLRPESERVGEEVIRAMHRAYLAAGPLPPGSRDAPATTRYVAKPGTPTAILVDLDGTVALIGARDPYDMTRVGEDSPNRAVIEAVRALHTAGHRVVYCSGRSEESREATEAWLAMNVGVDYDALYLRGNRDYRQDAVVKRDIFDRHLRDNYDVVCVLDDRRQVVAMWRALGLTVFQVADGNF